ncbi:ABC-2 transporter permease [Oceanobacillus sp. CAU 1775]
MYNLIRKDIVIQKMQVLILIPFILFFAFFASQMSPAFVLLITSLYIPLNGYIYDGMVKSNILLNSLPYTRKEIVNAKYVGSVVYMALSIALASVIFYFVGYEFLFRDIAIAAGLFLISTAIFFPIFYVLNPAYVGFFMILGVMLSASVIPPVLQFLERNLTSIMDFLMSLSTITIYLSGAAIAISFYLISWMVSQFIYQRKEF